MLYVIAVSAVPSAEACGPGRMGGRRRNARKLTPLVFKQHVPNVSENTLGASGLHEGRIRRNERRFRELVPNYNPDIVFKDEEGTGADRLMTPRMKEKLNTLGVSVMNKWPGVRLRVTEGFDEEGHHAEKSLHYEGRAVDITTNDRDRSKYGMLARLAVEAGFDWVYYESKYHIHISVKSEKSSVSSSGGCFTGDSLVRTPAGPRPLSAVREGDQILAMDPATGRLQFSTVLLFLDRDPTVRRLYYRLDTESGRQITLTESHLIFVSDDEGWRSELEDGGSSSSSVGRVTFARNVRPGQLVYTAFDQGTSSSSSTSSPPSAAAAAEAPIERHQNESSSSSSSVHSSSSSTPDGSSWPSLSMERVTGVQSLEEVGAFAPLTKEGTLVVNSVVASCYAVIKDQQVAHMSFVPVRLWDNLLDAGRHAGTWLLGRRPSSVRPTAAGRSSVQLGVHWYPRTLYSLAKYVLPTEMLY